jgi:hypothetical protein
MKRLPLIIRNPWLRAALFMVLAYIIAVIVSGRWI